MWVKGAGADAKRRRCLLAKRFQACVQTALPQDETALQDSHRGQSPDRPPDGR